MANDNLNKKEILFRLGYFRDSKNIPASKLSTDLNHASNYIYKIENNEMKMSIDTFLEALELLGVTTSEFFAPAFKKEDVEIVEALGRLTDENKRTIIDLINKLK
ncbi:MAG: helix-turn-helix transcriptional regulator [Clostridia bacterium]|nr:helix-turn-helix transcriptional regulator [Clostridia bacterium]